MVNQLTKPALNRNFQRAQLILGSNALRRVELDVNRRLSPTLALRTSLALSTEGATQHHVTREFKGFYLAASWRPFRGTSLSADVEFRVNDGTMGSNLLADGFSLSDRGAATTLLTAASGGRVFLPALGTSYDSTGRRRSNGTGIAIADERVLPRTVSFLGPNAVQDSQELTLGVHLDQRIGRDLNLQVSFTKFEMEKWTFARVGSSSTAVYRDVNPTLPSGQPNPYFNELYTEYYYRRNNALPRVNNARATAVYEWRLPFTTQKLVGSALYHDTHPEDYSYSEIVDPRSRNFKGSYNPANTLAAYAANVATFGQNVFNRRFYLRDGDRAELTRGGVIAGESVFMRDFAADSATGRLSRRLYRTPAYGLGADGSYLNGRVHTLVGWRRSAFNQDPSRDFFNPVTGETFLLDTPQSNVHTRISRDSYNYGAVVHLTPAVAASYSYAESISLSSGVGGAQLTPGQLRGPLLGNGWELGLRWSLLGGRIESNWTYYSTRAIRNAANPVIPVNVRQTELGAIFGTGIDTTGQDTQSTASTGLELETVTNVTKQWRLTWNLATNELAATDRYPALRAYQAAAKARGVPTPETDLFLASTPEGTPLPGYTKLRSNLVTMYRFAHGPLRDFSVGGAVQYRDRSYRGNFDLNQDGTAEAHWSPAYAVYNLMLGYRTKLAGRRLDVSLNVGNVSEKDYFRSFALATGAWGEGRSFRFASRLDY